MEREILEVLKKSHLRVNIWWRDDDIENITKSLINYYSIIDRYCLILSSIIPKKFNKNSKNTPHNLKNIIFCAHGTEHLNYEDFQYKRSEFGFSRSKKKMTEDLKYSYDFLNMHFNEDIKIFVPPWNKMSKEAATLTYETGFNIISASTKKSYNIYYEGDINTDIDLVDWGKGVTTLTYNEVLFKILEICIQNKNKNNITIGIMSHYSLNQKELPELTNKLIDFFTINNTLFRGLSKKNLKKQRFEDDF